MFIQIATENGIKNVNIYEIQSYKAIDDETGKFIYYILDSGITFKEYFDSDADREDKMTYLSTVNPVDDSINKAISRLDITSRVVVDELPTEDISTKTIYMVPNTTPGVQDNTYDEYMYIDNTWEVIGSTAIDMTQYLSKTNTTAFTPTGDYQPATKKYVDDHGAAITVIDTSDSIESKTTALHNFYENFKVGKEEVFFVDHVAGNDLGAGTKCVMMVPEDRSTNFQDFIGIWYPNTNGTNYGITYRRVKKYWVRLNLTDGEVTSIVENDAFGEGWINYDTSSVLGINNTTAFTPTSNYQPATKKYVDDHGISSITEACNIWELSPGIYSVAPHVDLYYTSNSRKIESGGYGLFLTVGKEVLGTIPFYTMGRAPVEGDGSYNYIYIGVAQNNFYGVADRYSVSDIKKIPNCVTFADVQTITGLKTFSTLPESSVVPTTDNQLVNKKFVDDSIASAIGNALGGSY